MKRNTDIRYGPAVKEKAISQSLAGFMVITIRFLPTRPNQWPFAHTITELRESREGVGGGGGGGGGG